MSLDEKTADPLATDKESSQLDSAPQQTSPPDYASPEELVELVSQLHEVDMTAEDLDPLEWTLRKVVPIPKYYYWEVVKQDSDVEMIPYRIKLWHNTVASMTGAYKWTEQRVGMPLARSLGLTSSRFSDVTMYMTDEDMKESKQIVAERKQNREDFEKTKEANLDANQGAKDNENEGSDDAV